MVALNAMDGPNKPPLSILSRRRRASPGTGRYPASPLAGGPLGSARGKQLGLRLRGEAKKETLPQDLFAFVRGFLFYCQRRLLGVVRLFWCIFTSGFTFSSGLKSYLQGRVYRKKGRLAFPLAHASLLGISLSLLIFVSGFGEFLFKQVGTLALSDGAVIVADQPSVATEESRLLKTEVHTYTVQEGDTLHEIARRFYLTFDALAYANKIGDPFNYTLQPGDKLKIPPIEGLTYEVRVGDTIESIAEKFQVEVMDLVEFNYLFPPYKLTVGQELVVPYVEVPHFLGSVSTPTGTCGPLSLSWPTSSHFIVGGYGCYISKTHGGYVCHRAIDLEADYEPLYAAADGTVVAAGHFEGVCRSFTHYCNYGYGGYVFIDIGGGYQIRYAHISEPLVGVDQKVERGQAVATSGESGYAFGPHLHFELLCNGKRINPLPYLK